MGRCLVLLLLWAPASSLLAQSPAASKEVSALFHEAEALRLEGKLASALPLYEKALAQAEKRLGADHFTTGAVLHGLGRALVEHGSLARAETCLQKSARIHEAHARFDPVRVGHVLHDLGRVLRMRHRFAEASKALLRSRSIKEAKLGPDHLLLATTHDEIGLLYQDLARYTDAISAHERARALFAADEERSGKQSMLAARCLNNLAAAYFHLGHFSRARPLARRSLRMHEERTRQEPVELARVLSNLGLVLTHLAEFEEAESLLTRARTLREKVLPARHREVGYALQNLGWLHLRRGQFDQADAFYQKALVLFRAQGVQTLDVADLLHEQALLALARGRFVECEALHRQAQETRTKLLGRTHPHVGRSLVGLGDLHADLGQFDQAEKNYRDAVTLWEEQLGKNHPLLAGALRGLGRTRLERRAFDDSRDVLRRAQKLLVASRDANDPERADTLVLMGRVHLAQGRHTEAGSLFREARDAQVATLGKNHPAVAETIKGLALVALAKGDLREARTSLRQALGVTAASLGPDHPRQVGWRMALACVERWNGAKPTEVARLFDQVRRTSRRHVTRILPGLPQCDQAAYLYLDDRPTLDAALSLGLAHTGDTDLVSRTATWLINGKAVAQEALARAGRSSQLGNDPTKDALGAQLRAVRQELARATLFGCQPGKEESHRLQMEQLASREEELARKHRLAGGSDGSSAWIDHDHLRRRIPVGTVFVDVARVRPFAFHEQRLDAWRPERYLAWITPAKGEIRLVDLGEAATIDAAVRSVRNALDESSRNNAALIRKRGESEAEKRLRKPLESLSRLLLKPLEKDLGGAERWVISPDGNLWLIPWEILLVADGKYAVENHLIRYVLSGRDLAQEEGEGAKGTPKEPVIVGDPDFDLEPAKGSKGSHLGGLARRLRLETVEALPGTRAQALSIARSLGGAARLYLGAKAREDDIKKVASPRLLVLGTHGYFLPLLPAGPGPIGQGGGRIGLPPQRENPLLRCGLLLAGCKRGSRADTEDDGVLTGLEAASLNLASCQMVVLSACNTGIGDVQNGEGVAGLCQAFRLAGARSVVSSLWPVPDQSSARLMSEMFAELARGKDGAEALGLARRKLIAQRREGSAAAHPFFWGAFTLTGR